ncbi:hypothetical protein Bca4012_071473 [Brassica carinata]
MATSEQGSLMIDVEDLVKARTFQALLAGSKVAVNKAYDHTSSKTHRNTRRTFLKDYQKMEE